MSLSDVSLGSTEVRDDGTYKKRTGFAAPAVLASPIFGKSTASNSNQCLTRVEDVFGGWVSREIVEDCESLYAGVGETGSR
jgi:hypothetical protein